ncbi:MAG TPA: glycosyltransferase [Caulobacteraceae bacterium]
MRWRLSLIRASMEGLRLLRTPAWPRAGVGPHPSPGPLVVDGFFGEALGVGRAAALTADALEQAGFEVQRKSLRPALGRLLRGRRPPVSDRPGGVWLIHANAPECLIALMTHDPADWGDRYRIGYWAWETPEIPVAWARVAPWLHEIWTPSAFVAEAVRAGLDRLPAAPRPPVKVMPHPVAAPAWLERRGAAGDGVVRTLVMFDGRSAYARKNPWAAIEAWVRAFPVADPGAALTVKVGQVDVDPAAAARLRALVTERSDIRLLSDRMDDQAVWRLIDGHDVFLSLHRSEGFGLGLAEAMDLGKTVIATAWSGNLEFMRSDASVLVPFRLVPIDDPTGAYGGNVWAEPDVEAAAGALRRVVGDPAFRAAVAQTAPASIAALRETWSKSALAGSALAALAAPTR